MPIRSPEGVVGAPHGFVGSRAADAEGAAAASARVGEKGVDRVSVGVRLVPPEDVPSAFDLLVAGIREQVDELVDGGIGDKVALTVQNQHG